MLTALLVLSIFAFCGSAKLMNGRNRLNTLSGTEIDIIALNYALTLEHLESAFYDLFVGKYDNDAAYKTVHVNASLAYFQLIRDHETVHVDAITKAIISLGGRPVAACNYQFGDLTIAQFIATAAVLENTGVKAYIGVADSIASADYRTVSSSIQAIESRHATYLNGLISELPFPDAFNPSLEPSDIAAMVAPFIDDNCADFNTLKLPQRVEFVRPSSNSATVFGPMILLNALVTLFFFSS